MKDGAWLRLMISAALAGTIGWGTVGCLNRHLAPAEPTSQSGVVQEYDTGVTKVDLLFVIDPSRSMEDEQRILGEQIEVMVRELIDPRQPVGGNRQPVPVRDLHLGVVSSDLGVAGEDFRVQSCEEPNGDDGVLNGRGNTTIAGCQASYAGDCPEGRACRWLAHSERDPDDDPRNSPIWQDFNCLARVGAGGCGYEQQLEASLRALDPEGNAAEGGPNAGFLRSDSLLAIIYVTDEDDCSARDPAIFDPRRSELGPENLRCFNNQDRLYPVQRYYDFFVNELRGGDRDRVVVAAITGIPESRVWRQGDPIGELKELQFIEYPSQRGPGPWLAASCWSDNGEAEPPVRLAELISLFGTNGILQSICQDDWTEALGAITRKIQSKLDGTCPQRPLANTSAEVCRVVETLADDSPCPHRALPANSGPDRRRGWQVDLGVIEMRRNGGTTRRRQCVILPADYDGDGCPDGSDCETGDFSGGLQGWFYDKSSDDPFCTYGQVRFTSEELIGSLSHVRFECQTALCPARRQLVIPEEQRRCEVFQCSNDGDCDDGETCVGHNSVAVCGAQAGTTDRPCSCSRCEPTIGSRCPAVLDRDPPSVSGQPLVREGGCCAEGFHVDMGRGGVTSCVPDRTTRCE